MKIDTNYLREKLTFIFNGMKINLNEEKNIKEFHLGNGSTIIVVDSSNIIGGNNEF